MSVVLWCIRKVSSKLLKKSLWFFESENFAARSQIWLFFAGLEIRIFAHSLFALLLKIAHFKERHRAIGSRCSKSDREQIALVALYKRATMSVSLFHSQKEQFAQKTKKLIPNPDIWKRTHKNPDRQDIVPVFENRKKVPYSSTLLYGTYKSKFIEWTVQYTDCWQFSTVHILLATNWRITWKKVIQTLLYFEVLYKKLNVFCFVQKRSENTNALYLSHILQGTS